MGREGRTAWPGGRQTATRRIRERDERRTAAEDANGAAREAERNQCKSRSESSVDGRTRFAQ
ncbi:MAG: hypothetical protein KJ017_00100 [Alphaproteobacteria bacterium]|nr:hypothetical protein [Alphaproteobacteria bacterium]